MVNSISFEVFKSIEKVTSLSNIIFPYLVSMTNAPCQYYIKKKDINTNPNVMFQLNLKENVEFKGGLFKENYKL